MSAQQQRMGVAAWIAVALAAAILGLLIAAPMAMVVGQAFSKGLGGWWQAVTDEETLRALRLTAVVALVAVPINTLGGLAAAWWIARFRFPGRRLAVALLDLPLSVSPVVAGLLFVLLFGTQGWWGQWLQARDIKVLFAVPGIALATLFVTLPMVARELLPLLQSQGSDADWAAVTLGASGRQLFWWVVFPRMRTRQPCWRGWQPSVRRLARSGWCMANPVAATPWPQHSRSAGWTWRWHEPVRWWSWFANEYGI